jgi:predicted NBD/HSP70 family sugar kinase
MTNSGDNPGVGSGQQEDAVLRFLRVVHEHGLILREAEQGEVELQSAPRALTQVEAARKAGLSRPSVASYAQRMRGTVLDEDKLAVRATSGYAIGIDISESHGARVALSDISGQILETLFSEKEGGQLRQQRPSEALSNVEAFVRRLLDERKLTHEQIIGVGISLPGPVKGGNRIGRAAGIWRQLSAADELARRLGWEAVPFVTQSDSYASALAENMWGGEQIATNTLFVKWAARLRAAIVIDGNLYVGHSGTAGELPHQELEHFGDIPDEFVDRGDLEKPCPVCSDARCLHMVAPLLTVSKAFTGRSNERASNLVKMAEAEPGKRKLLQIAAGGIGKAIAPLIEALDPESVVIGGALGSRAFPLVFEDLTDAISKNVTRDESVTVRGGRLQELTSVRGAVALALRDFGPEYLRDRAG